MLRINNIVFLLKNNAFRRQAIKQYKKALKNESLSYKCLSELNFKKRKKLVNYAYNNISFYKKFYDTAGFNPDMLVSDKDWEMVPILEKDMIRSNIYDIKNPFVLKKYLGVATTGGSTGLPLKIYTDLRFHHEILGWRAFEWWNLSPAANVGIIHRRTPTTFIGKLKNRLLWWPTQRIYLNASSIDEKQLTDFIKSIGRKKIRWLQGYVGGLERVAEYIIINNIKIDTLKLVWSTSAPLTKSIRNKLEKAFNCKVMNQYGSCEVPNIAIQCPHSHDLHVNYDYVHVDIVDDSGKLIREGEGDILVTNLESYAFPIIKYRIGDRSAWVGTECNCNIPFPLIREVKGRISDAIYTPDGIYVDGSYLTTIFDEYVDVISKFQVYQKRDYSVIIYVIPYNNSFPIEDTILNIKNTLLEKVHNKISVIIQVVDTIADDKGKIRYVISEVL
ncbi:MAG: hypothetical protein PHH37_07685 [Paludibacter sp.]|nr:hypothetical protein [Paludibacter sp.]